MIDVRVRYKEPGDWRPVFSGPIRDERALGCLLAAHDERKIAMQVLVDPADIRVAADVLRHSIDQGEMVWGTREQPDRYVVPIARMRFADPAPAPAPQLRVIAEPSLWQRLARAFGEWLLGRPKLRCVCPDDKVSPEAAAARRQS